MKTDLVRTVHLADYTPPTHRIERVELCFELGEQRTRVRSRLFLQTQVPGAALRLDGEALELVSLKLDGELLPSAAYRLDETGLELPGLPERCVLEIETLIHPESNTTLSGLYRSSGNFCTQCEAEGFRRITYFLDRPDVLSIYRVELIADRARYPVLLANGNRVEGGVLDDGRHFAIWEDPFPKPAYLFALVAGDLGCIEDRFVTASGREVRLEVYVQHHNIDKCAHAMASLKKAMAWDEATYGREYDLDIYMIVAVDDFNMGAMENKGLNIFNSRYVLARQDTATDADYEGIESVIAHEYFHNWSGNRVTCRDWFQLSLKEGFTVFRDQEFSADMGSRAVKRIQDVNVLRTHQFPEDAGPMAHPVRPQSYQEINNFYTTTIYNKGAEVVRMLCHLLGWPLFRQGCDLYFERHDGQAVTIEEFVGAMETVSGRDLALFRRWYAQAGTPLVTVSDRFDEKSGRYSLRFEQATPPTPGQPVKLPFHIPLATALFDREGRPLDLGAAMPAQGRVLELTEVVSEFHFDGLKDKPLPSLLRGFSAPVKLDYPYSADELALLMARDTDLFNRWDAGQRLMLRELLKAVETRIDGGSVELDPALSRAFGALLHDHADDPMFVAEALTLPSEGYIAEQLDEVPVEAVHEAREALRVALAREWEAALQLVYAQSCPEGAYTPSGRDVGLRRLRGVCLGYLLALDNPAYAALAYEQFQAADNMTDSMTALGALAHSDAPQREEALAAFEARWRGEALVMDKWFTLQATRPCVDTLERVRELTTHPAFDRRNPNKVRALIGAFARANPLAFHRVDGAGYTLLRDEIFDLDGANPQIAARLAGAFNRWRHYDAGRRGLMREALESLQAKPDLSRDVQEIVGRALAQD